MDLAPLLIDPADIPPLLSDCPWLAIDTESNSMYAYQERVCLIQLNFGGEIRIIDPLPLERNRATLGALVAALEDPQLPTYLHGGEYDVVCLSRDYELRPKGIYDSQQAASLLGFARTGYGALVSELLDIHLPKGHSDYNWGTRPLDPDAIDYAVDDVRHLPDLITILKEKVTEADLEEEVAIANTAVEDVTARASGYDPAGIWRLKGLNALPNHRIPILVALHRWRDDMAASEDQPPGRIIANDLLLVLARIAPTNFGQMRKIRLRSSIMSKYGDAIIDCIKTAKASPPDIPEAPAKREFDPNERKREQALKAWRREEAERREVTTQVVLPARALDHLKRVGAEKLHETPQLGDKRISLYGDKLREIIHKHS